MHNDVVPRLTPQLAAIAVGVKPRTLHKWAREGRIVRYPDGFELDDLLEAERSRDHRALLVRAGIKSEHWPENVGATR